MNEPWIPQPDSNAKNVLSGLVPTRDYAAESRSGAKDTGAFASTVMSTMPIFLAGSMAVSMTLTGAIAPASAKPATEPDTSNGPAFGHSSAARSAAAANRHSQHVNNLPPAVSPEATPALYTVVSGDTVSDIAVRFGLSTASVLALNGLGWKSTIFPGQTLRLTSAVAAAPRESVAEKKAISITQYTVVRGDTISHIAARFGVSVASVLGTNGLSKSSLIFPGQTIVIPVDADSNPAPVSTTEALNSNESPLSPVIPATPPGASTDLNPEATPVSESGLPAAVDNTVSEEAQSSTVQPESSLEVPATSPAPSSTSTYTIKSGDTLSKIAKSFGITIEALCSANGLTTSSVIYSGRTLVVPGGSSPASTGGSVTLLTAEGETNARTIISIGRELGVSDYGIVIALATAMQESTMRNLSYGHLDSVGLFQQRPASGWGSVAQLTTPAHAARLFYGGPSNPNKGRTRGLLDIAGWQSMTVTQAAQKVQISAYPDAYAKWESSARHWLKTL